MDLPGLNDLMKQRQSLEDFARDCLSGDEFLNVPITREELGVLASYREFMDQRAAE
jgi:hypothetical protein